MLSNLCNVCWCINSGVNASEHFNKCSMVSSLPHLSQFWKPLLAHVIFWLNSLSQIPIRAAPQFNLLSIHFASCGVGLSLQSIGNFADYHERTVEWTKTWKMSEWLLAQNPIKSWQTLCTQSLFQLFLNISRNGDSNKHWATYCKFYLWMIPCQKQRKKTLKYIY